ncbi:putative aspartate/glutamate/hydantoin racemase [Cupriavidus taiwanensis]|uniref:Aspartate/glutamate/hydantoin racemase n=1 Tax=Cupriavidus taiwanensis TaxID=164546 RepID=A0A375C834_9BURK|nr:LWXIA domain-containing protein [Cupriavidus taiwanensis]SOY64386.1 putative aspartate/glutamate/hydantoin racemase [Cupriavidus taiwanensis]
MLDFMDAIRAAARAAAEAAARAAAEAAREAAERAAREAAERAQRAAEARETQRQQDTQNTQQAQPSQQTRQTQQDPQARPADQPDKPQAVAVTPALYTTSTTGAQAPRAMQVDAPAPEKPKADPAEQDRKKKESDAKALTDGWQQEAKDAYDKVVADLDGRAMTDKQWQPLGLKYGTVMGGAQNELRVAANNAAATGKDVKAAVEAKAEEIRKRYDDPNVALNIEETKTQFLKNESTQQARDTQGARFNVVLAQDKERQAAAKVDEEQAAYLKIPGGIRRFELEADDQLVAARDALETAQQQRVQAEETFLDTMQKELDTVAANGYKQDADRALGDVRNAPHDRSLSMADRSYDLTQANSKVSDADAQLKALASGQGVKVPDSYRQQAVQDLKARYGTDGGMGQLIDRVDLRGRIAGEMAHLTPSTDFERELARNDPTTLAMAQAQGLTLDPKAKTDPNSATPRDLPQAERALMEHNPAGYVMFKSLGADSLVPDADLPATDPARAAYDKGVAEKGLLGYTVEQVKARSEDPKLSQAERDQAASGLNRMLGFMEGSVPLRVDAMSRGIDQKLDSGDVTGALQIRKAGADAAQTPEERQLYVDVHNDRFSGDLFKAQIEASMDHELKNKTHDDEGRPIIGQEKMYADKVGVYLQEVAPHLIEEDAGTLLDTVKTEYSNDWTGRNNSQSPGYNDWDDFYHGLSAVVDAADAGYYARNPQAKPGTAPAATGTASWLSDRDNEVSMLMMANQGGSSRQGRIYGGAQDAAAKGHIGLSAAFEQSLKSSKDAPVMSDVYLRNAVQRGSEDYAGTDEAKEANQRFELDKDEILRQTFDSLALRKEELSAKASDEKGLSEAIALGAPQGDAKAIREQIAEDAKAGTTVKAIPMYVTGPGGVPYQTAVFAFEGKDGKTLWVDDQGAVYGKEELDAKRDFQENNLLSDKGTVYFAENLELGRDGHAGYASMDAHIVTTSEKVWGWVNLGVAAVGAVAGGVLAVASGGTLTPLVAAAWVGMVGSMGYGVGTSWAALDNISDHGRSVNPFSSQEAMAQWLNVAGSLAGMGGMGLAKTGALAMNAGTRLAGSTNPLRQMAGGMLTHSAGHYGSASRVLNGVGFGIGGVQTLQQAAMFAGHGSEMSVSEKLQNGAMLLMGATQMLPMALQKRIGESVRDGYQAMRGRGAGAGDPAGIGAPGRGLAPDALGAFRDGAEVRAATRPTTRRGPAGRDAEGQPPARTDADGQPGRSGRQADGDPAPGAARPATPARSNGGRPAIDGGATPARDLRTPHRLTPWQAARLSTAAAFDMAVTRGALLQERVIHGMMDRAMSRAMARYATESAARSQSGERSGGGRADPPVPASRRRTATGTQALARAPRHPSGDGEAGVQRRTVSHGPAVVAHADGPEAPARMSLRQNAISPLDNVLWIDGSMENIGVPYGAEMAARALADLDSVMIVTGPLTAHGRAETNGPVGAASLGAYLASLGKDVVYVTDRAHARTLRKMLRQDLNQPNARVETFSARDFASAGRQSRALLAMHKPQAVVAVEVAGRNTNNEYRLLNGERVRGNAMLDQLLIDANDIADMVTIAVGDHGNEAGMRAARDRLLRDMAVTEQLADSWSDVGADHLVTGMNSNLAAQAIGFGVQRALGRDSGMPSVETVGALLDTMARHKARDGVTLEVGATSVRGYDKTVQKGVYELLQKAAERLPAGLDMAQLFEGIQRRFLPDGIDPADFGIRVQDDAIVITAFDSSNGGLLAAQNIARHTYAMTGKAVQVVAFTDHAAGTYGGRERGDLVNLVHAGVVAAQKARGAVDLFACNTACTAFPEALAGTHQAKVVNLIMQTAPKIVTEGGARPVVVATPGTVKLHAYLEAVAEASGGSVTVKEIGATEWADAVNHLMHLADGAQLAQLKGLVAKYINAEQIPADATSLWFCCTHYPALETLVRQQLDAIGRSDVKLIDPMQYQARKGVEMLVDQGLIDRGALLEQPLDPSAVPDDKTLPTIVFTTGQPSRVSGLAHAMGRRPDIRVFKTAFGEAADVSPALALVDGGRHLAPVDRISFNYIGRGLREFYMPGGAERAAASLEDASNVMLVTGFSVAKDMPETDGPPGTAELGRALRLRGKQVTYVVDSANRPILEGILREMGEPLDNIRVFDEPIDSAAEPARALLREVGPDRVMAIELPSRSARGTKHNMRGIGIDDFNPALDQIVLEANAIDGIETLGVGDGGNEAGMGGVGGLIPRALDGSDIAAVVPVDHVVTASVSNWGAYAVSALLLRRGNMPERFQSPEELGRVLQAAADAGAVDGVSRERVATVDGFSTAVHQAVITLYGRAAAGGQPRGPGAARAPLPGGPALARTPLADAAEAVVAHGGQPPRRPAADSHADAAGGRPAAAMPAARPAVRDGSWSVRDGAPGRSAIEATVDGIHASGGRLAGVHYVVTHGEGLSVPLRAGLPEASFLSLQQAMRDLGPALQAGGNFRIAIVSQREAARHGAVDARSVIGTVPLSLRGHKPHAEGFALNPDYHGEIRAAVPDDFRAGLPLVRQQDGRRIDVLAQLEQFPRGRADLDLAREAGHKTFGDEAVAVSVPQVPGHFTVRAEGLFGGIAMRAGEGPSSLLDAPAVIDRIRAHPDYQEGMPVVLYGCYGQDGAVSLVQELATGLNARVYGADGRLDVDAFRAPGSDLAHGARLRVAADPAAMAASGAPVHVRDGGRFHGAMPALPVVAVTSGGKPVRQHGARAAGDPVPAGWRQAPDRWAELALGEPAVRVNAPRDHLVVVGAVRPDGGLRGEAGDGGEGVGAHELAFLLAHDWEPGQPIVLALDGAHAPQGRMLAQQVADVMGTEVLVPEFALRRGAYAPDPAKSQIDLAQPGSWRRLSPQPDPYAGHSFKIDHHGNVFLRRPDGTRERVRLETYLGPRLGSGGAKTVFALGKDLAVGIANEAWLGDMVHGERAAMAEAAGAHGLDTVRSFGPASFEAFGRPAIGYERYAASTKDLFDATGRLRPEHAALLNDRSARDIAALVDTMATRKLHLGDVEFALFPDGAVKVADLTHVEAGSEAAQGSAVYRMLERMQEAARARGDDGTRGGEPGAGGVVRATISHGPAGNTPPPGSNGPRPWKVRTALAVSAAGTFAAASGAAAISAQTGANLVLTSASCFIYRGSVAMGRTVHASKVIRRAGTHTPADIAWLRRTLTEKPGTAVWGINDKNQQKFARALDQLEAYAHHADKKDLPEAADKIREAQAVLGTIGASLLTPDTRAGQVNDALQLTTLAINNGNTMLWFGEHGVTQIGEPLTYSSAVFLAANSVLSTVNFAARAGYHTGLAQPALLGARLRKFVMNAYSVGAVPLAVADMVHTGGAVGAIEAGSLAVFGIGAHLQSRNEQKLINAEKNRLARAADPDAVEQPVTPWLAQKWDFFGRAMPKGLVLLGGGVIVNFGAKILVELLKDEDKGAPRPAPTPGGGPSTPPTADPGVPTPPQQPPKEPPSQTPRERPASAPVRVQPYSPDHVASSTLWGIAGGHLDTLLSDGQKAEAQARAMTPDQQVANFALRELINLNPRYRLADNPDHLEPGWELDVTR